jgi:GDP/UDP-N,N'-diacetylbacillosamine 2-epimerase (hydrolysing)
MRTIAVFSFSRAESGLYFPIIKYLGRQQDFQFRFYIGGAHLLKPFGHTADEFENFHIPISGKIDFIKRDKKIGYDIPTSAADEFRRLLPLFKRRKFDYLMVLGDRWELIPLVYLSFLHRIPIFHIGGGENTEGVIDNDIRHAITKFAHVHFVVNEIYARNLSRMGEEDWRIVITGAPGLENIRRLRLSSRLAVRKKFRLIPSEPYFLVTFHPETARSPAKTMASLQSLLDHVCRSGYQAIVTYPNLDLFSNEVIQCVQEAARKNANLRLFPHLGIHWYLSCMKYCSAVIGNSSSGIVEAPFLRVPTINIGQRQRGRLFASSIIQVDNVDSELETAIKYVLQDRKYIKDLTSTKSLYGDGRTSEILTMALRQIVRLPYEILLQKKYHSRIYKKDWNRLCKDQLSSLLKRA